MSDFFSHSMGPAFKRLTEREHQILGLLSEGHINKVIGRILGISHDTVKLHVRHIYSKLEITSRVEAAVRFSMEKHFASVLTT